MQHLPDYELSIDEAPVWNPPPWFDPEAVTDWGEEPQPEVPPPPRPPTPPPPPSPPPRTWSRRKKKNPNWRPGGSFAGSYSRDPSRRPPRPDVTAIFAHLGIPSPSATPPECSWGLSSDDFPSLTRDKTMSVAGFDPAPVEFPRLQSDALPRGHRFSYYT